MEQFPSISRFTDSNGRLTVEGSAWIATLVEAIRTLTAENAALEARIDVLEGE